MIKVDFKDLSQRAHTPVLNFCRKLIKGGVDPDAILEVYRGEMLCIRVNVGEGAKLTIKENPSLCLAKYDGAFIANRR